MAEFPCMPVWTDSLLGDTAHLDAEQFGAYCLMLFVAWRSPDNSLPNCDSQLANITRLTPAKWKKSRDILLSFWSVDNNKLRQKKLDFVKNSVAKNKKQKSGAGKASALKRKETRSTAVELPLASRTNGEATTQNQNQIYKPPTPFGQGKGAGFNNGFGGRENIQLGIEAIDEAKRILPRADIYALESEWKKSGKEMPRNPQAAFIGWIRHFAKNHPELVD